MSNASGSSSTNAKLPHHLALAEGLVVTLILGSTLVLVKMVLDCLGPLTTTALRYSLAFPGSLPRVPRHGAVGL